MSPVHDDKMEFSNVLLETPNTNRRNIYVSTSSLMESDELQCVCLNLDPDSLGFLSGCWEGICLVEKGIWVG